MNSRVSVIIPYKSNSTGLAVLLTQLQMQTLLPNSIIILDNSETGEAKKIAERYQVNTKIIYEKSVGSIYESWNRGIELAGDDDVFIINDDVLLQFDTIEQLKFAKVQSLGLAIVPTTPDRVHMSERVEDFDFTSNFYSYEATLWMPGFAFYLPRYTINQIGLFDTQFMTWFGDTDYERRINDYAKEHKMTGIVKIKGCSVYHFCSTSWDLKSKETQKLIEEERKLFAEKWPL